MRPLNVLDVTFVFCGAVSQVCTACYGVCLLFESICQFLAFRGPSDSNNTLAISERADDLGNSTRTGLRMPL